MASILITGGSGTVGKAAGKFLCSKGHQVIGVSRSIEEGECFSEVRSLDLLDDEDVEDLKKELEKVDTVFHLAWNVNAENFNNHSAWKPNMEMFENVIDAAEEAEVPIFINGSSIHAGTGSINAYTVEGSLEKTPEPYRSSIDPDSDFDLRKEDPEKLLSPLETDPDSPYGWSKIVTERMTRKAVENGAFKMGVTIRIGGVNSEDKKEREGEPYYSSLYWSHRDLGRTIENIISSDLNRKKGYHQFYGVSDNEGRIFSIENSFTGGEK